MIWTAIILGFAGSLHCMLMCSPLAYAATGGKILIKKLLYNCGRILTYGLGGGLVAGFGKVISVSGFQTILTIAIGLMLIIMGISGISGLKIPVVTGMLAKVNSFIKRTFGYMLQKKGSVSLFLLGMVNGLLPCGITYLALTYCLTLTGPIDGFNFMIWFGLGTLPAMLGLTSILGLLISKYRLKGSVITRYSYIVLGVIIVARLFLTQHADIDKAISSGVILLCR
jgi:uncharacterized protein